MQPVLRYRTTPIFYQPVVVVCLYSRATVWSRGSHTSGGVHYEVCASFYPHRGGDSCSSAGSNGPNSVSRRSSAFRACASTKCPAESASAAENELKRPNRGFSKRPEQETV